jgi:hypothetical protein
MNSSGNDAMAFAALAVFVVCMVALAVGMQGVTP